MIFIPFGQRCHWREEPRKSHWGSQDFWRKGREACRAARPLSPSLSGTDKRERFSWRESERRRETRGSSAHSKWGYLASLRIIDMQLNYHPTPVLSMHLKDHCILPDSDTSSLHFFTFNFDTAHYLELFAVRRVVMRLGLLIASSECPKARQIGEGSKRAKLDCIPWGGSSFPSHWIARKHACKMLGPSRKCFFLFFCIRPVAWPTYATARETAKQKQEVVLTYQIFLGYKLAHGVTALKQVELTGRMMRMREHDSAKNENTCNLFSVSPGFTC